MYAVLVSTAIVYTEHRLTEPGLTGARLNALAQSALVYIRFVSIRNGLPFLSQLTNVNHFSKRGNYGNSHRDSMLYGVRLGFLSYWALIAALAHTRGLYLVQRGNRERRYWCASLDAVEIITLNCKKTFEGSHIYSC